MTTPILPTFIPSARRTHANTQRNLRRYARRKAFIDNLILFAFFTFVFAVITVALFS